MPTHVTLVKLDPDLLADVPGLDLPTVEARTYVLVDDDAKVCRVISEDELQASYIDNNIDTFRMLDIEWLVLNVDEQNVTINYTTGASVTLLLGSIDFNAPVRADLYGKMNGVIYPIDQDGNPLLNATNTPHLVAMRVWYHNEAKRVNDERIQIAEIVHSFTDIISELAHAAEHIGG